MGKKKAGKRRGRNRKIPLGMALGLGLTVKRFYDQYQASPNKIQGMIIALTGYDYITEEWKPKEIIASYAPVLAGYAVSTYIGGPKGLNVNAKMTGIPIVKL